MKKNNGFVFNLVVCRSLDRILRFLALLVHIAGRIWLLVVVHMVDFVVVEANSYSVVVHNPVRNPHI